MIEETAPHPNTERWHRGLSLGVGLVWVIVLNRLGMHTPQPCTLLFPVAFIWFPTSSHRKYLTGDFFAVLLRRSSLRWIFWGILLAAGTCMTIEAVTNPAIHARP